MQEGKKSDAEAAGRRTGRDRQSCVKMGEWKIIPGHQSDRATVSDTGDISVSEFMLGKRIEPEHYQEETEKAWIASLDEPLLYKIQMIIYILGIAAVAVLQVPLFSHGPMCVNIICWAVWGALFFAAYYLDKKIPERKLRYSNPWIEGVFSVIYFLCYMLWFFLRKDEWGTLPMSEQMSLWAIIVVGLIVGVCVRVFLARKKRRSAV